MLGGKSIDLNDKHTKAKNEKYGLQPSIQRRGRGTPGVIYLQMMRFLTTPFSSTCVIDLEPSPSLTLSSFSNWN